MSVTLKQCPRCNALFDKTKSFYTNACDPCATSITGKSAAQLQEEKQQANTTKSSGKKDDPMNTILFLL